MRTVMMKYAGLLICLIFIASQLPQTAATEVWSEDFTDISEWTIVWGEWFVDEGILKTYYDDETIQRISHPSTQTVGTWSFRINQSNNMAYERTTVWFMTNGTDTPDENYGYGLRINQETIYLIKLVGSWALDQPIAGGAFFSPTPFFLRWTQFHVTRNSTGGLNVYINKTLPAVPDISVVDTEFSYSERFLIDFRGFSRTWIDDIVVDDDVPEPLNPTPTPTPIPSNTTPTSPTNGGTEPPSDMTLIIAGAGVAVVIILVAVVFMRRR